MPILKTEILGSEIEIIYEEVEKERLTKLINQFKKRLSEIPQNGKINDKAIIFLSALKIEDELEENKKLLLNNKIDKNKINEKSQIISKLNNQIILLKTETNEFHSNSVIESNKYLQIIKKVQNLEKLIESIKTKINDEIDKRLNKLIF
jgi:cell division protein ZapA (FtsZ GTPase activity inhibitor)